MAVQEVVVEIHAPVVVRVPAKEAVQDPAREIPDKYGNEKTKDIEPDAYAIMQFGLLILL